MTKDQTHEKRDRLLTTFSFFFSVLPVLVVRVVVLWVHFGSKRVAPTTPASQPTPATPRFWFLLLLVTYEVLFQSTACSLQSNKSDCCRRNLFRGVSATRYNLCLIKPPFIGRDVSSLISSATKVHQSTLCNSTARKRLWPV